MVWNKVNIFCSFKKQKDREAFQYKNFLHFKTNKSFIIKLLIEQNAKNAIIT